jgi:hypothetical protein
MQFDSKQYQHHMKYTVVAVLESDMIQVYIVNMTSGLSMIERYQADMMDKSLVLSRSTLCLMDMMHMMIVLSLSYRFHSHIASTRTVLATVRRYQLDMPHTCRDQSHSLSSQVDMRHMMLDLYHRSHSQCHIVCTRMILVYSGRCQMGSRYTELNQCDSSIYQQDIACMKFDLDC